MSLSLSAIFSEQSTDHLLVAELEATLLRITSINVGDELEGISVGYKDGISVGAAVGEAVGFVVGMEVGAKEGKYVGPVGF